MQNHPKKLVLVLSIQFIIATFFFFGAEWTTPKIYIFYHSFFADIFIPFSFYFLLTLNESKFSALKNYWLKFTFVFLLCSISEMLQYFGIFALARTFDPLDFLAYATGGLLAIFFDKIIFTKVFSFWK